MAWTAPMTFADGTALTAAQLNTYLRDNLNETMAAKATTEGAMFFGTDTNELVERVPAMQRVNWTGTTTSASWTDLSTGGVGPTVTLETSATALIFYTVHMGNSIDSGYTAMSYDVTGASSLAAETGRAVVIDGIGAYNLYNTMGLGMFDIRSDLTPGENTFTLKYSVGSGTGIYAYRFLAVWPL